MPSGARQVTEVGQAGLVNQRAVSCLTGPLFSFTCCLAERAGKESGSLGAGVRYLNRLSPPNHLAVSMADGTNGPESLPLSVNGPKCWAHFLVSGLILFLLLVLTNSV